MVPPKDLYGTFYFLLNVNKLTEYLEQNNPTWIGTIVHEITHIIDYIEYAKLIGANNYDEIQNRFEHGMFNLWTEFNARYNGYYFMRKNISIIYPIQAFYMIFSIKNYPHKFKC